MPSPLRLAVDIGGTFTDTVLMRGTAALGSAKTLTTHDEPALGALEGARDVLAFAGFAPGDVSGIIHGTTLATNALIERRGARVAAITTEGFRDILEIAYERRYAQYDIDLEKPDLIVPRSRCFTVPERMDVSGRVVQPLNEGALDDLVGALTTSRADVAAICLLHAYANPVHEQRLRATLADRLPDLAVSLSSEVSPEAREFDRLSTTVANAYVQPLMARYLARFAEGFQAAGLTCPILMMTAGGGMTTLETAARLPIRLVESGPAGGAILAARIAREAGEDQVLSFDMGGTTAKLCLIDGARPQTSRAFEIARAERFVKGSGMPVRIPVIDMIEIGAGGGSIASVDRLGRLMVGPESAGSQPGPAAFGRGGVSPTVTDADIVQGLIDPAGFAEGRLDLDPAAAGQALAQRVGAPLDMAAVEAAQAVSDIVGENMANAARMHGVESGKDLSLRTMIAFGGNGPLHATRVARRAGVRRIIVPPDPGVGSAVGFLFAPVSFEIVQSRYATLDDLDLAAINGLFDGLIVRAEAVVQAGAPGEPMVRTRTAFMRYRGQGHEIEVALPDRALTAADTPDLRAAFEDAYAAQFSRPVPGMVIEILNWAVSVSGPVPEVVPARAAAPALPGDGGAKTIRCDLSGRPIEAAIYARAALAPGSTVAGPALITEPQTTTLVSADFQAAVDGVGNLVLTRMEGSR
ncbi:MAG: hydantoinase/oxoprolinase family protein [Pseudomonadota bacterium]